MKVDLNEKVELKPCPLCASEAFLHTNSDPGRVSRRFWVKCDNLQCGCTTDSAEDGAVALARWNQRLHEVAEVGRDQRPGKPVLVGKEG